jgi:hypothetical protein
MHCREGHVTDRTYFEDGYLWRIPSCFLVLQLGVEFSLWVTVVFLGCQCHMNMCVCVCVCVSIWYDIANNETYRLLGDATATWPAAVMSLCIATGENFKNNSRQFFCSKINVPSVCYKSKACSQAVQQQDLLLLLFIRKNSVSSSSSNNNIYVFLMGLSVYQHSMTGQRDIVAIVWSSCYYVVYISTASQVLISHIDVLPSRCSMLHYMHDSEASLPPQLVPHREYSRCSSVSSVPTRTTHRTRCYLNCSYLGVTQVTHSFS